MRSTITTNLHLLSDNPLGSVLQVQTRDGSWLIVYIPVPETRGRTFNPYTHRLQSWYYESNHVTSIRFQENRYGIWCSFPNAFTTCDPARFQPSFLFDSVDCGESNRKIVKNGANIRVTLTWIRYHEWNT